MNAFGNEIKQFTLMKLNNIETAWVHLERAHVIGQFDWKKHFYVHVLMIAYAVRTKNLKEFVGQIPRLVLAIPGSVLRKAPYGNIGTSKVGIFQPMPISDDIKLLIKDDSN